jgi:hypothetical protein
MASFWERVQNALDDQQRREREERERQQAREQGYQRALYEVRDALLVSALSIKEQWQNQLLRDGDRIRSGTDARYAAQLQGLNEAFTVLRQIEPRITTQVQIDEFRASVAARAEEQRLAESKNGYVPRRLEMDSSEYQRGYEQMRTRLDRKLPSELNRLPVTGDSPQSLALERRIVHNIAVEANREIRDNWGDRGRGPERLEHPDFERGQRKSLMDWSHEHNHRLIQRIEAHQQLVPERNSEVSRQAQRIRM